LKSICTCLLLSVSLLCACKRLVEESKTSTGGLEQRRVIPEESTFFSTAFIEEAAPYDAPSDGDLWPSAWSDDDFLYTANGDGKGFNSDSVFSDIVSSRISGYPLDQSVKGVRLTSGNNIGTIWGDTAIYNRKPTGMISVGGVLYLAVQDLNKKKANIFNEAPSATILRSGDKGHTWQWNKSAPMFKDHIFTTVMFLDYGKDGTNNTFDKYVYAYGLDYNWRDSFSDIVPDPDKLYLARMPKDGIQDVTKWEFYTGDLKGRQSWSEPGRISDRRPVLQDNRRRYQETIKAVRPDSLSVISQGGIVYNKGLNRYIYTSWTEFTFEFYDSPTPWGPWKLFLSKDFGGYPWTKLNYGGYATVAPSKFISSDGREMWISSSTFVGGIQHYNFSLRRLWLNPYQDTKPSNKKDNTNLALSADPLQVTPISAASIRHGKIRIINDRNKAISGNIDSYSVERKQEDYWGFTWPQAYYINELAYTTGTISKEHGGWFKDLQVQVRQNFKWMNVSNLKVDPAYTFNSSILNNTTYKLTFDTIWGDGIRIIGKPGGSSEYTSIAELEVYNK